MPLVSLLSIIISLFEGEHFQLSFHSLKENTVLQGIRWKEPMLRMEYNYLCHS